MAYDPIEGLTIAMGRIEDKLDKHDDKFELIAQTLQKLVAVDIELKNTKDALTDIRDEVKELKEHQTTDGCPAHKAFVAVRNEQLKGYQKLAEECSDKYTKLEKRVTIIEEAPKEIRGYFLKGFLGAIGAGFLSWIIWTVSQFGVHK